MDTLTHAVSGALVYKAWTARKSSPLTRWGVPLAMCIAASPDVDIFFAPTPVDFLLLHRGITHALAAMPIMALLAALCMFPLWKGSTPQAWSFKECWLLGLTLIALHVFLDCITTYGTMIFLPFSDYRVRLNGMFIVDLWLLIPMVLACLFWPSGYGNRTATIHTLTTASMPTLPPIHFLRGRRALLWAACAWMLLYPVSTVVWRMQLEGQELISLVDKAPLDPTVLPDALSPLHWRILYGTAGISPPLQPSQLPEPPKATTLADLTKTFPIQNTVHQQGLSGWAQDTTPLYNYPAANPDLVAQLRNQDVGSDVFFNFTMLPLQYSQAWEGGAEYLFYDLRFNSLVPFVRSIMAMRSSGQVPFLLRARFDQQHKLVALRLTFSGGNRDSGWYSPKAATPTPWYKWLVGLR